MATLTAKRKTAPRAKAKAVLTRKAKPKAAKPTFGQRLVEGMKEVLREVSGEDTDCLRFTIPKNATLEQISAAWDEAEKKLLAKQMARKMKLAPPAEVSAARVKAGRDALGLSQQVFADFLGVGVALVRAWEGGTRSPKGADRRLLADIVARPDYWRDQVRLAKQK